MIKKISFIISLLMVIVCISACYENESKEENTVYAETDSVPEIVQEPSLEELKVTAEQDTWGYYKWLYAFLTGDAEYLASAETKGFNASEYESLKTVKFSSYEIKERELAAGGGVDFKFTVSESDCPALGIGEYHYHVGPYFWLPQTPEIEEGHEELVDAIDAIANAYCISWEDGRATSYEDKFFFGIEIVNFYLYIDLDSSETIHFTDDMLKEAAKKMFGVEYYEKVTVDEYYFPITTKKYLDIRQVDENKYEIDVQYYADRFQLILSHKVTIYVTETDDPDYKYFFEKSVIIEKSNYDPYYFYVG